MEFDLLALAVKRTLDVTVNESSHVVGAPQTQEAMGFYSDEDSNRRELAPIALLPTSSVLQVNVTMSIFENDGNTNGSQLIHTMNMSNLLRAGRLINKYYLWVIFAFGFPGRSPLVFAMTPYKKELRILKLSIVKQVMILHFERVT
ncbi:hypothetical protein ElyMa_003491100 [Elysia marginata]|uniref:Uncharacterized protein n=1 Tax=Elysia marginata TaxID=1093978 RepID=A0AAV4EE34_9GAST|nr:hypothetical protein ElyMa_003491100 [Elysia marginata]